MFGNDLRTKVSASESYKGNIHATPVTSDTGGFIESLTATTPTSSSDPMAKLKSKRRLNNIGGPVVSSGLAGKRDTRSRHSTGRPISNSLPTKNIGSLFGDEDESKEMSVTQSQKLDARDDYVSIAPVESRFTSHYCLVS